MLAFPRRVVARHSSPQAADIEAFYNGSPEMAKNTASKEVVADPELVSYIKAGYPLLYMVTPEESRAELEIARVAEECGRDLKVWSATDGIQDLATKTKDEITEPNAMLRKIAQDKNSGIMYVLRDLHPYFKHPGVVRNLRDIARDFKQLKKTVIILSPVSKIPPELERDAIVIDFELPTRAQITETWSKLYRGAAELFASREADLVKEEWWTLKKGKTPGCINEDEVDRIISAALGLTDVEAENAFSKAIVQSLRAPKDRPRISRLVMKEKANAIKKQGTLEYFDTHEGKDDIGGLEVLKHWVDKRSRAFSKAAREFGLPMPKGILLIGLPGCGKSLTAKAAANMLQVPFIRFDISRVFGGIVGQSEQQMRAALQTIERVGQCVVWIDEAEKAFAGMGGSGSNDSGVTKRVFGNFLTWMQEKSGASFVVMTVNNIQAIQQSSPEMLRKGRFDEIFFCGLPSQKEREVIFAIHIRKNNRLPKDFDIPALAKAAMKFSGAEIEMAVVDGLFTAFYDEADLTTEHILKAVLGTNPLAESSEKALDGMKKWADKNAVNASANGDEGIDPGVHAGRKLEA